MNFLFERKVKKLFKSQEINYWDKIVRNHPSLAVKKSKKLSDYFNRKLYFNLVAPLAACYVLLFACVFTFKNSISNLTINDNSSSSSVKDKSTDNLNAFIYIKEYVAESKDAEDATKIKEDLNYTGELNLAALVAMRESLYEQ